MEDDVRIANRGSFWILPLILEGMRYFRIPVQPLFKESSIPARV